MHQTCHTGSMHSQQQSLRSVNHRHHLRHRRRQQSHLVCSSIQYEPSTSESTTTTSDHIQRVEYTPIDETRVKTVFIAETLLPTRSGKFRLRGYKHSVGLLCTHQIDGQRARSDIAPQCGHQVDGGTTFTEPTAILCGIVEGQENVLLLSSTGAASRWTLISYLDVLAGRC
jgi:hypothetical protein